MDTLTHALSGALVARVLPATRGPTLSAHAVLAAGAASALFPDLDFALRLVDTLTYLNHHQGVTHSLLLWPLWSVMLAFVFARLTRRPDTWRAYLPITLAGTGIHIAGDLITAYGTQLFAPFSARRYAGDIQFLLDAGIFLILLTGVVVSLRRPQQQLPAGIALVLVVLYVSGSALLRQQAVGIADIHAGNLKGAATEMHVLPQPPSPFHWLLVIRTPDALHSTRVNLLAAQAHSPSGQDSWWHRYQAAFHAPDHPVWLRSPTPNGIPVFGPAPEAWNAPALEPLRRFMRFPVVDAIESDRGEQCVRFADLRFTLPGLTPAFRFGGCRTEGASPWSLRRWPGDVYLD